MTYVVCIYLSSEGKWYVSWLWRYMTYVLSIIEVASSYCIMCILVISICVELCRWESHITIPKCSWPKSMRKLYDYSGVFLWIIRWPVVRPSRGVLKFYVGMKWKWGALFLFIWGALFLFIWGVLFYSYVDVVYLVYIMSLTSLWKFCWISNFIKNLLFIIMTGILLWLNRCLIKL